MARFGTGRNAFDLVNNVLAFGHFAEHCVAPALNVFAAVVDNGVVLESDVDGLMQSVKLNAREAGQQLPDDATLRHQILERLIMDNIQLQMAKKMGINMTDADVDRAIGNIAQQNNMSMDQMRSRLAADGINYKTYRDQIRKEMLISEVRNNEVRRRVTILPQEVEALAKQVGSQNGADTELNLSHILIALPENPSQQQVDDAEQQARQKALIAQQEAEKKRQREAESVVTDAPRNPWCLGWARCWPCKARSRPG